jgi:pilus assembly protein CpaC
MRVLSFLFALVVAMLVPFVAALPAGAASSTLRVIDLAVSEGRLITLSAPAATVLIADPAVADIQVPQQNRIFIFGKKPGSTTLYALGEGGRQIAAYTVTVHLQINAPVAALAQSGAGDVKVTGTDTGTILHGTVPDAAAADRTVATATGYAASKDAVDSSQLSVASSQQVMLRVWIGEVSRNVTKDLAFNWDAGGIPGLGTFRLITGRNVFNATSGCTVLSVTNPCVRSSPTFPPNDFGSIITGFTNGRAGGSATIDALTEEGLVTTLAEPTLTAMTGQVASFLAGGEFPIPFSTGLGNVAIQFQTYGVSLNFVPTVISPNRISLKVNPQVSDLSTVGEVDLNGFTVPGLTIRQAQTTIELGSGESFAIAGLLQNTSSATIQKYPGLGDLPVIGALFRSNNFQRNESELVIICTPYLVRGVDDPNKLLSPTDGMKAPNDLERIFRGRLAEAVPSPLGDAETPSVISALRGPRLAGDAGFELE